MVFPYHVLAKCFRGVEFRCFPPPENAWNKPRSHHHEFDLLGDYILRFIQARRFEEMGLCHLAGYDRCRGDRRGLKSHISLRYASWCQGLTEGAGGLFLAILCCFLISCDPSLAFAPSSLFNVVVEISFSIQTDPFYIFQFVSVSPLKWLPFPFSRA